MKLPGTRGPRTAVDRTTALATVFDETRFMSVSHYQSVNGSQGDNTHPLRHSALCRHSIYSSNLPVYAYHAKSCHLSTRRQRLPETFQDIGQEAGLHLFEFQEIYAFARKL